MSDASPARVEPVMEPRREAPHLQEPLPPSPAVRPALDQLARIEEKAARMEEKYARAEAIMLRLEQKVEQATGLTGALARQSDLDALAARVRRLPGFGALIVAAIVAAVLAAVLVVLAQHYNVVSFLPALK